ncbi:hypothetical protein OJAV_G00163190 [Oryzias javanicus]|uniref:UPAR/Ly6 domain-containing protein n=1 Tax=Oryzias javanicus TaxID=123683 RepID=A0A3S2MA47_ORYJA|nr:hypothetical protein OJAV_G00163190 [Oryzias javanicus]
MKPRMSKAVAFLIAVLVTVSMAAGSQVKEKSLHYDCCNPIIEIDSTCDNILSCDGKPFARFKKANETCSPPCKVKEGKMMTLSECVNITRQTWCMNGNDKTEESVTNFFSHPCPPNPRVGKSSAAYQSSITMLLMPVLVAAKFLL